MQCVIPQVGGSGNLVRGDPHQQLLIVPPGEQEAASRQAEDAILVQAGFQGQHLQLLLNTTETFRQELHSAHLQVSVQPLPGTVEL